MRRRDVATMTRVKKQGHGRGNKIKNQRQGREGYKKKENNKEQIEIKMGICNVKSSREVSKDQRMI